MRLKEELAVREVGGRLRLIVTERLLIIPDPAKRIWDYRLELNAGTPLPEPHTCIFSDERGRQPCAACDESVEG